MNILESIKQFFSKKHERDITTARFYYKYHGKDINLEICEHINYCHKDKYIEENINELGNYYTSIAEYKEIVGGRNDARQYFNTKLKPNILDPIVKQYNKTQSKILLILDFDDCYGFPTTFLKELFINLLKDYYQYINICIISFDQESLYDYILEYIYEAINEKEY